MASLKDSITGMHLFLPLLHIKCAPRLKRVNHHKQICTPNIHTTPHTRIHLPTHTPHTHIPYSHTPTASSQQQNTFMRLGYTFHRHSPPTTSWIFVIGCLVFWSSSYSEFWGAHAQLIITHLRYVQCSPCTEKFKLLFSKYFGNFSCMTALHQPFPSRKEEKFFN